MDFDELYKLQHTKGTTREELDRISEGILAIANEKEGNIQMSIDLSKTRLYIFDCDGTLTTTKSGETFRKTPEDWEWLPGRVLKLHELFSQGMRVAIATNQGGVAFGYMPQEDILAELTRMCKFARIPLGGLYVCYNHPKASLEEYRHEDERRKPGPGMLLDAMRDFQVDADATLFVGDRPEDEQAATNAGVAFVWANEFFGEQS